jgi:hypothetical protein
MEEGWVKINRKLLDWEWFTDCKTLSVFLFLILRASYEDSSFRGTPVPRGTAVTSLPSIAKGTGLTIKEVRTAINHLKGTGELAVKTYSKFGLYTVNNYDKYQTKGSQPGSQGAVNGQSMGTIKEYKELKERKNNMAKPGTRFSNFEQRTGDLDGNVIDALGRILEE